MEFPNTFIPVYKAEKIVAWNAPVMQFMMYTVIIIIVAIGGRGIVLGTWNW